MAHIDEDEDDKDKIISDDALPEVLDEDADELLADPLAVDIDPDEEKGGW